MSEAKAESAPTQWLVEQLCGAELLRTFQLSSDSVDSPGEEQVDAIYARGYAAYKQGQYDKAVQTFLLVNMLRPLNPAYVRALGLAYKRLELYNDAIVTFTRAYVLVPDDLDSILEIAHCLLRIGRVPQALRVLEAVREEALKRNDQSTLVGATGLIRIARETQVEPGAAAS